MGNANQCQKAELMASYEKSEDGDNLISNEDFFN